MPQDRLRAEYAEWLATPPPTGVLIETVEFTGRLLPAPLLFCNRRVDPLVATDELGVRKTYVPIAFKMTRPAMRASTEFATSLQLDGVDGALLQMISKLRPDDLRYPLNATLRWYIDPIMLSRPVWPTGLVMRVESVKVGIPIMEISLVGGRLPTKRAGTTYDISRFVGLRPF
jgi:hypothetical protein